MYRQTMSEGLLDILLEIGTQRLLGLPGNQKIHKVVFSIPQRFFDEFRLADPTPTGYDGKLRKSMG